MKKIIKIKQLIANDVPLIRSKILKEQNGLCPICKKEVKDPCLDHHHKKRIKGSGLIRGVLCRNCNSFIAKSENGAMRCGIQNKDLPFILRNIADFFEKKPYPLLHPSEKPKTKKLSKRFFKKLQKEHQKKYPKKKVLDYPKSGKPTKNIEKLCNEFGIKPEYLKGK